MELQLQALFLHDDNGRLVARNEPVESPSPAPRFFLGRTRHGNLWRFRADLPDELVKVLARLAAAERAPARLEKDPERLAALRDRLEAAGPLEDEWCGPAYRFPDSLAAPPEVAPLDASERPEAAESFPRLGSFDDREPVLVAREQGRIVSLCYAATRPGPAVEAGVETLPEARGRGHAARVTAAWACAQRARGVVPLFSTSWQNRASRAVADELGLIPYASDLHMR